MRSVTNRIAVLCAAAFCFFIAGLSLYWSLKPTPAEVEADKAADITDFRKVLSEQLGPYLLKNQLIEQAEISINGDPEKVKIDYTIDTHLQTAADKLLKAYKPDYGAIVLMDTTTGRILAMSSYTRGNENADNLALRGTFPAASIFKIVTATAAMDKHEMTPNTIIMYNGSNHTLYKRNVMNTKVNRWTREISLRDAFAKSVNTVFGRIALERLAPKDLEEYSIRFGFNKDISSDLPFDPGFTEIPQEKNYQLTEISSGFNKVTTMSPIQGAMIAASVAEDGVMRVPYIVDKVSDDKGQVLFQSEPVTAAVTMSPKGAERLKELMEATVRGGTSRKSFRTLLKDRKFKELEVGGKTGSITGSNPRGKVDWFVGYAIGEHDKIAVAAITVNVDFWVVKSAYLAQSIFRSHFKEQFTQENQKFFQASQAAAGSDEH